MKHLSIYVKFLKDLSAKGTLRIIHISRDVNLADMLVKQQPKKIFKKSVTLLKEPFTWKEVLLKNNVK